MTTKAGFKRPSIRTNEAVVPYTGRITASKQAKLLKTYQGRPD